MVGVCFELLIQTTETYFEPKMTFIMLLKFKEQFFVSLFDLEI